ncbi:hypothetical protein GT755_37645 [Herbidospora sp. NEAU-GS84]|uniref:Uncharacterized protein n=1 Tax=Herbidospora solisilvae TaxID=2696284 RepID=A0A7C9J974_9ACTN|nr:hypothetical protein [Herbidospora solisilvae]NAS27380.1 hypothetical protein [Herbidospora solisilvae]
MNLGTSAIAELLGISRPRVWQLRKDPTFPESAGRDDNGREYWRETDILRWAATARKDLAAKAPLLWRPTSGRQAPLLGLTTVDRYAIVLWDSEVGRIGQVYAQGGLPGLQPERLLQQLMDRASADILVGQDAGHFNHWGPDLIAVDGAVPERVYKPRWEDLARVLGTPAPYWPDCLVQPEEMARWRPGLPPPAVPPRHPELDTAPLDRLHRDQPDTPAGRAVLHMARQIDAQAAQSARIDLKLLDKSADRQSIALAATMLESAAFDDPDEATLRAGWAEILDRADALARDCVLLATDWDSGRYFPFSTVAVLRPEHSPAADVWRARLQPAEPTAAMSRLSRHEAHAYFTDPTTGLPALIDRNDELHAAVPQRLYTTAALAEVILSDNQVWIRTDDGILHLAPKQSGCGLSWGYSGSGPTTLAYLIHLLLDDITALAPARVPTHDTPLPDGLWTLIKNTPQGEDATYNRDQLLAARQA